MNKTIWVIVVLVIVVVGGWLLFANKPMAPATTATDTTGTTGTTGTVGTPDNGQNINTVYITSNDPTKGAYMASLSNMTLYTYDKDAAGTITCYGTCAVAWPPYTAGATPSSALPSGISLIARSDGAHQYTYNGKPLYYYAKDTAPGQVTGDNVGGVWHIIKM